MFENSYSDGLSSDCFFHIICFCYYLTDDLYLVCKQKRIPNIESLTTMHLNDRFYSQHLIYIFPRIILAYYSSFLFHLFQMIEGWCWAESSHISYKLFTNLFWNAINGRVNKMKNKVIALSIDLSLLQNL